MPDSVIDATVIGMANGDIAGRRPGNILDRRLQVIEQVVNGARRLRYNAKLLAEYRPLTRVFRNDVIELFFAVLADRAVLVRRSTLARQVFHTARNRCDWPRHDQHLLAAALDGDDAIIFVTEFRLARCGPRIFAHFAVRVEHLA
jgi:hypothetical protein